jgi:hypothetical protein
MVCIFTTYYTGGFYTNYSAFRSHIKQCTSTQSQQAPHGSPFGCACEGNYFDFGQFSTHINSCIYGGGGSSVGDYQSPIRIPQTIDLRSNASFSALASIDGSTVGEGSIVGDHQNNTTASLNAPAHDGEDVVVVDAPLKYKLKKQQCITGFFNQFRSVNAPTVSSTVRSTTNAIGGAYICRGCQRNLRNAQGYGKHIKTCTLYHHHIQRNAMSLYNPETAEAPAPPTPPVKTKTDGRSTNSGSNYRISYTFSKKHKMVEEYLQWKYEREDNNKPSSVALYCEWRYNERNGKKFEINIGRWRSEKEWPKIVAMAKEQDYKYFCKIPQNGKGKLFPRVEVVVYAQLKDRRKKKRKVSKKWVQIQALKEFKKQYAGKENKPSFKVRKVILLLLYYCRVF